VRHYECLAKTGKGQRGLVSKTTTNDGCCVLEFEEQNGALLTHIFFPTIRVVLSDVGGFEQSSPARRNDRVFLGFENSNFKPLSAQGERGQFPRVDGFSSGRRGVRQDRYYYPFYCASRRRIHWANSVQGGSTSAWKLASA